MIAKHSRGFLVQCQRCSAGLVVTDDPGKYAEAHECRFPLDADDNDDRPNEPETEVRP